MDDVGVGRVPSEPGSRPSDGAAEASPPVSFDPSRVAQLAVALESTRVRMNEQDWRYLRASAGSLRLRPETERMVANLRILGLVQPKNYSSTGPTQWVPTVLGEFLLRLSDRDGSGEAGQTADQAGPEGQQPGPKASPE